MSVSVSFVVDLWEMKQKQAPLEIKHHTPVESAIYGCFPACSHFVVVMMCTKKEERERKKKRVPK